MSGLTDLADRDWKAAYEMANQPGSSYKERALRFAILATHENMSGQICSTLALTFAQLHLAEVMEGKR